LIIYTSVALRLAATIHTISLPNPRPEQVPVEL
jgi:hypothetical protein